MEKRDPLRDVANTSSSNDLQEPTEEASKQPDPVPVASSSDNKENGFPKKTQSSDSDKSDVGSGSSKSKGDKLRLSFLKAFDPLYSESPEKQDQAATSSKLDQESRPKVIFEEYSETALSLALCDVSDDDEDDEESSFIDARTATDNETEIENKNLKVDESLLKFYTPEKYNTDQDNDYYDYELPTTSESESVLTHIEVSTSTSDQVIREEETYPAPPQVPHVSESEIVNAISKKLTSECNIIPTRSKFTITESELENYNILRERLSAENRDFNYRPRQENASDPIDINSLTSVSEIRNISPERSAISLESETRDDGTSNSNLAEEELSINRASGLEREESSDDSQESKITVIEKRSLIADLKKRHSTLTTAKENFAEQPGPSTREVIVLRNSSSTETSSAETVNSTEGSIDAQTENKESSDEPTELRLEEILEDCNLKLQGLTLTSDRDSNLESKEKQAEEEACSIDKSETFLDKEADTEVKFKPTSDLEYTPEPNTSKAISEFKLSPKSERSPESGLSPKSGLSANSVPSSDSEPSPDSEFLPEDHHKPSDEPTELRPEEVLEECQLKSRKLRLTSDRDSELESKEKQAEEGEFSKDKPEALLEEEADTELEFKPTSDPEYTPEPNTSKVIPEFKLSPKSDGSPKSGLSANSEPLSDSEPSPDSEPLPDSELLPEDHQKPKESPKEETLEELEVEAELKHEEEDKQEEKKKSTGKKTSSPTDTCKDSQKQSRSDSETESEPEQRPQFGAARGSEAGYQPPQETPSEEKTEDSKDNTSDNQKPTDSDAATDFQQDEERHLDSGVDSIEDSYIKSPKSQTGDSDDGEKKEEEEVPIEIEDSLLPDEKLDHTDDELKIASDDKPKIEPDDGLKIESDDQETTSEESKTLVQRSIQDEQSKLLNEPAKAKIDDQNNLLEEPTEPDINKETVNLTDSQKFNIKTADIDTLKIKMADLSEKLSEQQQENSDLKLQLNAIQQARASLELEIRQKEEVIIKTQAEALKNEQIYKQEIKQLREKLKENSKLIEKDGSKELEDQLKEAKAREAKAIAELNQRTKDALDCQKIMEEYENTIATRFADLKKLKEEHETATHHLANIELAFSDVHQKYERTKTLLKDFKSNEEALKAALQDSEKVCEQHEERYESLKAHAKGQIEKSNKEILMLRDKYEMDINKLKAIVKRLEIKCSSLEVSLQQKTEECAALSALCDEVTGKRM